MSLLQDAGLHVDQVATESLQMLAAVAARANQELTAATLGSSALASVNTLNAARAVQRLDEINSANLRANKVLAREPAIARVVVVDGTGNEQTYYICRAAPVSGVPGLLASHNAPMGRLASLPVGTEFKVPNGNVVEVIERALLRPCVADKDWDSRNTVLESVDRGPVTIESLRALLRHAVAPEHVEDLLSRIVEKAKAAANVFEGIKRNQITKMGLRDQPVLDQYQDEIFRLPLDRRLLILGPPGTGKTTTLIRRLGQKLNASFLSPEELSVVNGAEQSRGTSHADSWIMFTPTELLKQYLKEAFAREHVPASDLCLKTWQDYRRELGRSTLGILRTANSGGTFTLKDATATLRLEAITKPTEWFADFDTWQRRAYVQQLELAAQVLNGSPAVGVALIGKRVAALLKQANPTTMPTLFLQLATEVSALQALVSELKLLSDTKLNGALNLAMNRDPQFIGELARLIDQHRLAAVTESDDQDEADELDGEDEDPAIPKTGQGAAVMAYLSAVRAQARAQVAKRGISKSSQHAKIIEWLGPRTLSPADLASVGSQLLVLTAARRFVNPIKRYLDGVPKRYRAFRRDSQELQAWYRAEPFPATDLHPLELDLLLLTHLRAAGEMLSRTAIARRVDEPFWSALQTVQGLYKHQILVDEATDFSPIQLACMAALTHPQLRSFFACGDFNQRLTTWGSRSLDEMRWVLPDIEIREVSVAYRQSQQLNDLARAIIETLGGADSHVSLPLHVDSNGQKPVLLEGAAEVPATVAWLAERIREIERYLGQLPSTAIFVNAESDVQAVADALNAELEDSNIRVVACPKGQVMGQDTDVRVFDIQHIKGLEFESVFFMAVDRLAASQPALFDKYLYVGTTRAATYLGLSCVGGLPPAMEALRPHFAADWSQP